MTANLDGIEMMTVVVCDDGDGVVDEDVWAGLMGPEMGLLEL